MNNLEMNLIILNYFRFLTEHWSSPVSGVQALDDPVPLRHLDPDLRMSCLRHLRHVPPPGLDFIFLLQKARPYT